MGGPHYKCPIYFNIIDRKRAFVILIFCKQLTYRGAISIYRTVYTFQLYEPAQTSCKFGQIDPTGLI